ncbi:hypothetical protein INR49_016979, partial [Caranx melampygus]
MTDWLTSLCKWRQAYHFSSSQPISSTKTIQPQLRLPSMLANKDPLFLTGVTFPSEHPASPETLVKLTVYDAKDKSQESVS